MRSFASRSQLALWAPWLLAIVVLGCVGDPPAAELSRAQRDAIARRVVGRPPAAMIRTDAHFRDDVSLAGYLLEPRSLTQRAGAKLKLTLVWQVTHPLPRGWLPFTHLVDNAGRQLANLDASGPLRASPGVSALPLPPWRWPAAHYLLDELAVEIPVDAPRQVRIEAGFHRGRERLAVTGKAVDATRRAAWIKLAVAPPAPPRPHRQRAPRVPELTVPALSGTEHIVIDGQLDEPAWAAAPSTGAFVHPTTGKRAPPSSVQGSARLRYDKHYLFVAFEVADRDLRGGFAPTAIDPHLWTRDTVELMIDPDGDGDGRDYYEIQLSPQNLVFDSQFDSYNQPHGGPHGPFGHERWSADLDSAVSLAGSLDDDQPDTGYRVEARIPWRSFAKARRAPPIVGDSWRMNFYAMERNSGVAWSPIAGQGNFHRASRFGRIHFSGAPRGSGDTTH